MSSRIIVGAGLVVVAIAVLTFVGVTLLLGDDQDESDLENGEPAALGESTYQQQCSGCHTIDGSDSVGPTFEGLFNSEVTMDDGSTVLVDEDHLYEAITDPRATTREGFPDVMPSFSNLSDDDVTGLVAFIRTLE